MGIKKRPANLKQISTTTTLPEPKRESFPQQPDTPGQRKDARAVAAAAAAKPSRARLSPFSSATLSREETSGTLVDHREEASAALDDAAPSGSQQASSSHGTPEVASLDQSMSSLKLDLRLKHPPTSSSTNRISLSLKPSIPTRHHRRIFQRLKSHPALVHASRIFAIFGTISHLSSQIASRSSPERRNPSHRPCSTHTMRSQVD